MTISSQVKSSQVKSSQVKSSQVKSSQEVNPLWEMWITSKNKSEQNVTIYCAIPVYCDA